MIALPVLDYGSEVESTSCGRPRTARDIANGLACEMSEDGVSEGFNFLPTSRHIR